ncbi:MAG TPA: type II toxin-antitoxin system MqsA family antitoxin [Thermodesulfobacteriota bacterium]|nr:type II toxin-antitoxin system MqsA family antitoxin [Thermodesulfobacteriota bacterium]
MHKYGDCSLCGGEVKRKMVDELDYRYGGKPYIFREVPAGVCQQCGEVYLTAKAAKEIERIIRTKVVSKKTIPVPVYVFPEKMAV